MRLDEFIEAVVDEQQRQMRSDWPLGEALEELGIPEDWKPELYVLLEWRWPDWAVLIRCEVPDLGAWQGNPVILVGEERTHQKVREAFEALAGDLKRDMALKAAGR